MKFLKNLDLKNKRVLIRCDFNVPLNEKLEITDANRIKQSIPTIQMVLDQGGKAILMSHLGNATEQREAKYSLSPIATKLSELLGREVPLAPDCVGPQVEDLISKMESGSVLLLENLRYHSGEQSNDPEFSSLLKRIADVYVNDAFGTCHRKHASMVGVAHLFKEKCVGLLVQKELEFFERALHNPNRPLCVVLGGAKVSTKLNALINIKDKADKLIIGGAMANTFLAAQGYQMGKSLVERDLFQKCIELLGHLARRDCKVYLPVDVLAGPAPAAKGVARAVPAMEMPADLMALDIGPATSLLYKEALQNVETIVWNGPMGAFENEDYSKGTTDMIESIASSHGLSLVGGGDTDAAIHQMELAHKFSYISTGGGAFLGLLEGKTLPAIQALG